MILEMIVEAENAKQCLKTIARELGNPKRDYSKSLRELGKNSDKYHITQVSLFVNSFANRYRTVNKHFIRLDTLIDRFESNFQYIEEDYFFLFDYYYYPTEYTDKIHHMSKEHWDFQKTVIEEPKTFLKNDLVKQFVNELPQRKQVSLSELRKQNPLLFRFVTSVQFEMKESQYTFKNLDELIVFAMSKASRLEEKSKEAWNIHAQYKDLTPHDQESLHSLLPQIDSIIELDPELEIALLTKIAVLIDLDDLTNADELLKKHLPEGVSPDNPFYKLKIRLAQKHGKTDSLIKAIVPQLLKNPTDATLWGQLTVIYGELGDLDYAWEYFMIASAFNNAYLYSGLAEYFLRYYGELKKIHGPHPSMVHWLKETLFGSPYDVHQWIELAYALSIYQLSDSMVACLRQAWKMNPHLKKYVQLFVDGNPVTTYSDDKPMNLPHILAEEKYEVLLNIYETDPPHVQSQLLKIIGFSNMMSLYNAYITPEIPLRVFEFLEYMYTKGYQKDVITMFNAIANNADELHFFLWRIIQYRLYSYLKGLPSSDQEQLLTACEVGDQKVVALLKVRQQSQEPEGVEALFSAKDPYLRLSAYKWEIRLHTHSEQEMLRFIHQMLTDPHEMVRQAGTAEAHRYLPADQVEEFIRRVTMQRK